MAQLARLPEPVSTACASRLSARLLAAKPAGRRMLLQEAAFRRPEVVQSLARRCHDLRQSRAGDLEAAAVALFEAGSAAAAPDSSRASWCAEALALAAVAQRRAGRPGEAQALLASASSLLMSGDGDPVLGGFVFEARASVSFDEGDFAASLEAGQLAFSRYSLVGDAHRASRAALAASRALVELGESVGAVRWGTIALSGIEPRQEPTLPYLALYNLAWALGEGSRHADAQHVLDRAEAVAPPDPPPDWAPRRLWLSARWLARSGRHAKALAALASARREFWRLGLWIDVGATDLEVAVIYGSLGDAIQAQCFLRAAAAAFTSFANGRLPESHLAALAGADVGRLRGLAESCYCSLRRSASVA